jgi:RNA polymerase sigma factor (sigma-70 family)
LEIVPLKSSSLDALLKRLSSGDTLAVEEVFCLYEPYLRSVVRRMLPLRLRSRFDSVDIVQSVWCDVLETLRSKGYQFANAHQLRAFLVTATRNRFFDRYRQHDKEVRKEAHLVDNAVTANEDFTPSQIVQANELWERLLALCPLEHRTILQLKREGASTEEIAERTGLHPGSIRRILRSLASRLPFRGPASESSASYDHA